MVELRVCPRECCIVYECKLIAVLGFLSRYPSLSTTSKALGEQLPYRYPNPLPGI